MDGDDVATELRELAEAYAAAVDARDEAALRAVFAADALVVLPPVLAERLPAAELRGPELGALIDGVRNFRRTRHLVTGQSVTVDADGAEGETSCTAHHVYGAPDRQRDLVLTLRYRDSFVRTPAGWRFRRRELVLDGSATEPM
jgi:hypothetical protein